MRRLIPLTVAAVLAACGGPAGTPVAGSLPAPLADLVLVEDHPQIPPAPFPHARHVDAVPDPVPCVTCHHTLADAPDETPQPCRACHVYAYLADPDEPPVDESVPHEHPPPDL